MDKSYESKIEELKAVVRDMKCGVLFTGAGISVPSGIPDFRSAGGLYNTSHGKFSAEYMLSRTYFSYDTDGFYDFYKNKMIYRNAKPNVAHKYFANLEKEGKLLATVTQNIDGLHSAAGAKNVYELHGSVYRNHCMRCGKFFNLDYVMSADGAPKCDACGGVIHPDVVLYEENLDDFVLDGAINAISQADVMFVVGTSLVVYPAASLVEFFEGKHLVLVNKGETNADGLAEIAIHEDVTKVVRDLQK